MGRPICRRGQQGRRAETHHRGRQAPRRRRPEQHAQVTRPHRVRGDHAGTRRDPRHGVRAVGQQGLELRLRAGRGGLAQGFPQGHHYRGLQRGRAAGIAYKVYRCWVSEFQALPDLDANANAVSSSTSSWKTKAGNGTTRWPSQPEPTFTEPQLRHAQPSPQADCSTFGKEPERQLHQRALVSSGTRLP